VEIDETTIEDLRGRYDRCFGCGAANPIGLHLGDFTRHEDSVSAAFTPRGDFAGFEDTLHGGIVATALDEVSAWAAMLTQGVLVFTATLDIRYRSVARSSDRYRLRGTVVDRRGRRLRIESTMAVGDRVVAESAGLFVVAEEHTAALGGG
jgi:acyl-coenzyme A thioesterase PaaI-like protein